MHPSFIKDSNLGRHAVESVLFSPIYHVPETKYWTLRVPVRMISTRFEILLGIVIQNIPAAKRFLQHDGDEGQRVFPNLPLDLKLSEAYMIFYQHSYRVETTEDWLSTKNKRCEHLKFMSLLRQIFLLWSSVEFRRTPTGNFARSNS